VRSERIRDRSSSLVLQGIPGDRAAEEGSSQHSPAAKAASSLFLYSEGCTTTTGAPRDAWTRIVARTGVHGCPETILPRRRDGRYACIVLRIGEVEVNDGVALIVRGDVLVTLWSAPARLHRSRWVYDAADELVARSSGGVVALMVVLPTSDPPDGPTRSENAIRMKKLKPSLRRLVTVVLGDDLRQMIVRSILRILALPLGQGRLGVASSVDGGIDQLLRSASPTTPSFAEIGEDAGALFGALGLDPPRGLPHVRRDLGKERPKAR
jgi:hypothetical protein